MADQPMLDTPTDLGRNDLRTVADALNGSLADCYALYLKTKNFHWHVSGPHFRDYHLLLDDQAAQILGVTDAIAERVRKTGGTTLRSIGDVSRRQSIVDNDRDFVPAQEMLAELREDNLKLVESLREARTRAEEANDTATSSLADEWIDQAEERAWFLFEATRKQG
jgi:starvation-inducible DNA-binding protein